MDKYGIITGTITQQSNEACWSVERKEENGTTKQYNCIEFTDRTDFSNVQILGSAEDFNAWLNEHGSLNSVMF